MVLFEEDSTDARVYLEELDRLMELLKKTFPEEYVVRTDEFSDIDITCYITEWKYSGFENYTGTHHNYTELLDNKLFSTYNIEKEAYPPHFYFDSKH